VIGRQKTDGDDFYDDGYDYAAAAYSSGNEMLESESDEEDEPQTQPLSQAPPLTSLTHAATKATSAGK